MKRGASFVFFLLAILIVLTGAPAQSSTSQVVFVPSGASGVVTVSAGAGSAVGASTLGVSGVGTYASMPAAGTAGRIYFVTDGGPFQWVDDGSTWHPIVNGLYGTAPPASSSLTWVNQGSCSVADTNGQLVGTCPASTTGGLIQGMVKTSTGTSAVACARTQYTGDSTSADFVYPGFGVFLRESSTGKICSINLLVQNTGSGASAYTVPRFMVQRFTDANTRAAKTDYFGQGASQGTICARVRKSGGNVVFEISQDLVTWVQPTGLSTLAVTTCFTTTSDQSGVDFSMGYASSATGSQSVIVQHLVLQ